MEVYPPVGYFVQGNEGGIIYLLDQVGGTWAIEKHELLQSDEGNIYIAFKKRGKEEYFLCPLSFFQRLLHSLKEGDSYLHLRLVFIFALENIEDNRIGFAIDYKISVVDIVKFLLEKKQGS